MYPKEILFEHGYDLYKRTMEAAEIAAPGADKQKLIATLKKINRGPRKLNGKPNDAWDDADWVLRLLSIAYYASTEIDGLEEDADQLLSVLCLGNWAIGAVEGMLANENRGIDFEKFAASFLANKRHSEHRQLFAEALEYWAKNIDPNLSAQKAANILVGIVPLSHKKLAELVSGEKRKQKLTK